MTATIHPQSRDQAGIFATTPAEVLAACRVLLAANGAYLDAEGYAETKRLGDARREAQERCEDVILSHQGASFLNGVYRVDGWLIGFRKGRHGKGGLQLVMHPNEEIKKGLRS